MGASLDVKVEGVGASLDVKVEGVGALRGVWHVVQGADALIAPILKVYQRTQLQ